MSQRYRITYFLPSWLALALCLGATGCGEGNANLGIVEGTVTLDGTPLKNAHVQFQPSQGSASYGVTDASGHYDLYFAGDTKGAEIGEHTVRITTPGASEDEPQQLPKIPSKYNTESGLTANVEKGSNTFDFGLASE